MKLLLYCTKSKPYLYKNTTVVGENIFTNESDIINGKIVGECDFEVEEINSFYDDYEGGEIYTPSLNQKELLDESCLNIFEINEYLIYGFGYAIHINNLHIFDKPRELSYYCQLDKKVLKESEYETKEISNAPQNMMYCEDGLETKIIISIHPEWLCKILNGEKTIEIRKKVLKEML